MCCCKKKIVELEKQVEELKAAINRVSLATCGQPALATELTAAEWDSLPIDNAAAPHARVPDPGFDW